VITAAVWAAAVAVWLAVAAAGAVAVVLAVAAGRAWQSCAGLPGHVQATGGDAAKRLSAGPAGPSPGTPSAVVPAPVASRCEADQARDYWAAQAWLTAGVTA
jgi:hypothetical protein